MKPLVFCLLLLLATTSAVAAPQVITSIAPLHAMTSVIMRDIAQVDLLIDNNSSPHGFRLQPSAVMRVQKADLVIWIGPDLESKMVKSIRQFAPENRLLTALDLSLPSKLPNRQPGLLQEHGHEHSKGAVDPHIWLDPDNAIAISTAIAERLSKIDPEHSAAYRRNSEQLVRAIKETDLEITALLKPVQNGKFVTLHDALQYFEKHYHLQSVATLTVDSHKTGSAKRLAQLKSAMISEKVLCVLHENMPDETIVDVLLEGSNAHAAEIYPLGLNSQSAQAGYPGLLRQLAKAVSECLADTGSKLK
jgi:zinc transport system substrate-binding protein